MLSVVIYCTIFSQKRSIYDKFTYYISLFVLNQLFNKFTLDLVSIRHKVNTSLSTKLHKHFHLALLFINLFQWCPYIIQKTFKADVWCIKIGIYHYNRYKISILYINLLHFLAIRWTFILPRKKMDFVQLKNK